MRRPQKNGVEPVDEHDQPTEPMNFVVSPFAPTATGDDPATIPAPDRPFSPQMPPPAPLIGAYPFLPPAPARQSGNEGFVGDAQPENNAPARSGTKRHSIIPALVGLVFVAIQLMLLVRFVLTIIPLWDNITWVNVFYSVTALFIWPVQTLLQQVSLPAAASIEISTLLAILAYGLLSRILVRCLKLIFRSR